MLSRIIDWHLKPLALAPSTEAYYQARLAVMFTLVGVCVGLGFAAFYVLTMDWSFGSFVLGGAALISISLPLLLRVTRSVALAVNLFALTLCGVASYIAWLRGGFAATALFWLVLAPLITLKLLSRRTALVWTGVALATFWTFWGLNRLGSGLQPQLQKTPGQIVNLEAFSLSLMLIVLVTILGLYERSRRRLLAENERLTRATEAAERLESLGRLAGGICHDFNNLLAVVLSHSEMALEEVDSQAEVASDLRAIREAASKGAGLARQLLSFSRHPPQAGQAVDVNEALAELRPLLPTVLGSQVELVTELGEDLPRVRLEWAQLDRVVLNLLMNARDAMPGGGRVTLRTSAQAPDGPRSKERQKSQETPLVGLSVIDTGTGMSDEVQAHLFEPFFTTKNDGSGTGLGLATVYGIVCSAGGSISVTSALGLGTRVDILLPGTRDQAKRAAITQPPGRALKPGVALLVDDEPAVLKATSRRLERAGLSVLRAGGAAEALELLDEYGEGVDVLLTDVRMPGMDGPTLAGIVHSRYPGISILLMSGMASIEASRAATELAFPLLDKPFSQEQLRDALRRVRPGLESITGAPMAVGPL